MIKSFRKFRKELNCYEVTSVNLRSGKLKQFTYQIEELNGQKFIKKHSHYEAYTYELGCRQPKEYVNRARRLMHEPFDLAKLDQYPEL